MPVDHMNPDDAEPVRLDKDPSAKFRALLADCERAAAPKPGNRSVCRACGNPIMFTGQSWTHKVDGQESEFRHPGVPQIPPAPTVVAATHDTIHQLIDSMDAWHCKDERPNQPPPDPVDQNTGESVPLEFDRAAVIPAGTPIVWTRDFKPAAVVNGGLVPLTGLIDGGNLEFVPFPPRREVCVRLSEERVWELFSQCLSGRPFEFVYVVCHPTVPRDAKIRRVHHDQMAQCFVFTLAHPSFAPVGDGDYAPVVSNGWVWECVPADRGTRPPDAV